MATKGKGKGKGRGKGKAAADRAPDASSGDDLDLGWLEEQLNRPDAVHDDADDEPIDPELASLRPHINWFRPFLMLSVAAFAIFLMTRFSGELEYFFSPNEPIELGEVTDFPARAASDPDWRPVIPHNRYVSVSGIPSRRTVSCSPPVKYFKLIGGHVYVEAPMGAAMSTLECESRKTATGPPEAADLQFFDGAGRAVALSRGGPRYRGLKNFYEQRFGDLFCSELTEAKKQKRLDDLRQVLREQHKAEHGEYPSDAKLEELLAGERICHNAYIIQTDKPPSSYWPYLAIYIGLGLILLWNVYVMVRWTLQTVRALR